MLPPLTAPVMRFLRAVDPARATAFYRDVLGFEVRGAEAVRGPVRLGFRADGDTSAYLETSDLAAMHAGIVERGGAPEAIAKLNWVKLRMFTVRDPEGNTLWFGQSYNVPDRESPLPMVEKALPSLPCTDVAAAVAHYRDVLGFHINYQQVDLGVMDRDAITILLIARTPRHTGIGSAYFYIANADALHAELTAKGANVRGEPVSHPWGLREFLVLDPEGNELRFAQTFE
jgi:catechol 2,3-dioxygenase-like lactoylglutathione lyase family enzyme